MHPTPTGPDLLRLFGARLRDEEAARALQRSLASALAPLSHEELDALSRDLSYVPRPAGETPRAPSADEADPAPIARSIASIELPPLSAGQAGPGSSPAPACLSRLFHLPSWTSPSLHDAPERVHPCAQRVQDQGGDHFTPFGARVPAPIAEPPRRSAPVSLSHMMLVAAVTGLCFAAGGFALISSVNRLAERPAPQLQAWSAE